MEHVKHVFKNKNKWLINPVTFSGKLSWEIMPLVKTVKSWEIERLEFKLEELEGKICSVAEIVRKKKRGQERWSLIACDFMVYKDLKLKIYKYN